MNTAALLLLSLLIAPALALAAIGSRTETWRTVTAGAVLLTFALGGIRYLLS